MTMTLSDLDPQAAHAACPVVAREYRACRCAAENAADRFHLAAQKMAQLHERGLKTEQTEKALVRFRSAYTALDEIRDQLDSESI